MITQIASVIRRIAIVIRRIAIVITKGITLGAAEAGASDCWTSDTPDLGIRCVKTALA